jgi:ABC-type transport system substrate-binding protein
LKPLLRGSYSVFPDGRNQKVLGYSNPKLDEIIDLEQQTLDAKKREKLLWDAQRIILEDAPAVPLWNSMDIYAHRADLVWSASPDEKVQLKDAYLKAR